jgi:Proto-chlorophyllide reductase 57 kD subunit
MKFLCVRCDEAMKLEGVEEPEDGSLSVVFACLACGNRMAMLTNPWETQLVRALDVKIGGRSSPAAPMEFVRSMLSSGRESGLDTANSSPPVSGVAPPTKCPFSAMANLAAQRTGADGEPVNRGVGESGESERTSGSPDYRIAWSPEATNRLERIPEFIRPMIRQGIEQFAAQRGYRRISEDVMIEARVALGM